MLNMTFDIHNLPQPARYQSGERSVVNYFEQLLSKYDSDCDQCAFLPSLSDLSKFLNCPMVEIHCALQQLRDQGYDFFIFGTDCPITITYPHISDESSLPARNFQTRSSQTSNSQDINFHLGSSSDPTIADEIFPPDL